MDVDGGSVSCADTLSASRGCAPRVPSGQSSLFGQTKPSGRPVTPIRHRSQIYALSMQTLTSILGHARLDI
eukprot:COSAG01_NODE_28546_length_658_cov_1.892665_2_plen_70_part_01